MSEFRSVNQADKTAVVGGSTSQFSSRETTAALAQGDAPNVQVAKTVSDNAAQEHNAAEEAAKKARELGERFTGRPGGDVNDEAIKKSLHSTEVKLDQVYPAGAGAAKDVTGKASETAQQAAGSAKGALNAASTKAGEAAQFAANKASDAYNAAASTASSATNTAANKGSQGYNATASTASNAANTASNRAAQAGGAASNAASQTGQAASETGARLVGTIRNTASAAVNMTGGYLSSARDAAAAATQRVLETVGMEGAAGGPAETQPSQPPAASAQLETGKHSVDGPYPASKTTAGGGVNVAEVGSTPSARN